MDRIVTAMIASAGAAPEGVSSLRYSFCAESAIRSMVACFTGDLTIPNNITEIGWSAFSGCSRL